ncbi:hypothetical protein EP1X_08990 [Thermococcus sp. EP1]|uniref:hypothetical protein n=1 Tax=Thermococcus sp. EP1 TaxID=1591054 RepID=UPI0006DA4314|nr:hypothetical protein [Thermococcus sp. EP1]KPU62395.1 hypothetical protein EP1X_08990 [Thermococcus sp. EP1]
MCVGFVVFSFILQSSLTKEFLFLISYPHLVAGMFTLIVEIITAKKYQDEIKEYLESINTSNERMFKNYLIANVSILIANLFGLLGLLFSEKNLIGIIFSLTYLFILTKTLAKLFSSIKDEEDLKPFYTFTLLQDFALSEIEFFASVTILILFSTILIFSRFESIVISVIGRVFGFVILGITLLAILIHLTKKETIRKIAQCLLRIKTNTMKDYEKI